MIYVKIQENKNIRYLKVNATHIGCIKSGHYFLMTFELRDDLLYRTWYCDKCSHLEKQTDSMQKFKKEYGYNPFDISDHFFQKDYYFE